MDHRNEEPDPHLRPAPELLSAAAAREVSGRGIDTVSATSICAAAGVSRPTLYSYFGDVDGVLAQIWIEHGADWLHRLLTGSAQSGGPRVPADPSHSHEQALDRTLLETVVAAPRRSALAEVVTPDLEALWTDLGDVPSVRVRTAWVLALELGGRLAAEVTGADAAVRPVAALMRAMPDDYRLPNDVFEAPEFAPARPPASRIDAIAEPDTSEVDATTYRLLDAAVRVVANVGVARATFQRIARAARVTTGAARPRFPSLEGLLELAFNTQLQAIVEENRAMLERVDPDAHQDPWVTFAGFLSSALHPNRTRWRRYRQELHLSALHDARLRRRLTEAADATGGAVRATVATLGVSAQLLDVAVAVNYAGSLGLSILHDLGIPVAHVDHRLGMTWLRETSPELLTARADTGLRS
jgi:AcrR family transcriptional regulator